jgi:hypothetical protein
VFYIQKYIEYCTVLLQFLLCLADTCKSVLVRSFCACVMYGNTLRCLPVDWIWYNINMKSTVFPYSLFWNSFTSTFTGFKCRIFVLGERNCNSFFCVLCHFALLLCIKNSRFKTGEPPEGIVLQLLHVMRIHFTLCSSLMLKPYSAHDRYHIFWCIRNCVFDQGDVSVKYLHILPVSRCGRSSLMPQHFPLKLDSCYRPVNMVLIFCYYVFK